MTLFEEMEEYVTWLINFAYETISTPAVDGSDGIFSSTPPTTCITIKVSKT